MVLQSTKDRGNDAGYIGGTCQPKEVIAISKLNSTQCSRILQFANSESSFFFHSWNRFSHTKKRSVFWAIITNYVWCTTTGISAILQGPHDIKVLQGFLCLVKVV